MAHLELRTPPSRNGSVAVIAQPGAYQSLRPAVVLLHGALRNYLVLRPWLELVEPFADAFFIDLPGHGRSPAIAPATLDGLTAAVADAIRAVLPARPFVIVGESLGGLVGLALAGMEFGQLRGVLAADPPLTTAKLWHVHHSIGGAAMANPDNAFLRSMAADMFGIKGAAREEHIYYPLLGKALAPVHIVTGDIPLLPPRAVAGVPCLVDGVDQFVIKHLYARQVTVHALEDCGHLILTAKPEQCLTLVRQILGVAAEG